MATFTPPQVQTNFVDENGVDLGLQLVTKSQLIDEYPNLIPAAQRPALYVWGFNPTGELGDLTVVSKC